MARIEQAEAESAAILAEQPSACEVCGGSGRAPVYDGSGFSDWYFVRRWACRGTGEGWRAGTGGA